MEEELAKELREATDQLLDLGPLKPIAFTPSPHLLQRRQATPTKPVVPSPSVLPASSATSKLEVIHSPTDVRPFHWPAPPTSAQNRDVQDSPSILSAGRSDEPIKVELGGSLLDDADDNLPARGLSSRMESVKAATAQASNTTDSVVSRLLDNIDGQERSASPSKLRVRTPINDIYINQYGERIVNGKVVGRILGGRPRPASRNEGTPQPSGSTSTDRVLSPNPARSSSPLCPPSDNASASESGAKANATSPPAFFLESFPDAFSPAPTPTLPAPSSSPGKKKERRPSAGHRPPSILKGPRAVSGALILSHDDEFNEAVMVRHTSFHSTASDFGSPSSSSSKQLSLSPIPRKARLSSTSSRVDADAEVTTALKGLQLQGVEAAVEEDEGKGLLSPNEGGSMVDSTRSKIELPTMRRPTPTIELSQVKVETVVLHGNQRQARASGFVVDADTDSGSRNGSPAMSTPTRTLALPSLQPRTPNTDDIFEPISGTRSADPAQRDNPWVASEPTRHPRHGSASEPASPLRSPRSLDNLLAAGDNAASNDGDKASLVSLPVSNLTSSSRSASYTFIERRSLTSRCRSSSHRHSSSPTEVFAREVRIRGWSEVGSQARGWVVFELRILTKQGTPIITHKRFSSFVKLRRTLLEECKDQAKWLPQLPTRRTGLLSKYDAKYLETRRRALQRWLETVALDRVWGGSEGFREWVLDGD
ncbi:hypothetical protein NDA13_005766 [Ustilago tritici]|nr:hypothetical protein NDA13_005766 [Ustilago tritici]